MSLGLIPTMILFEVNYFQFFKVFELFAFATVTGGFASGDRISVLKSVGLEFGPLVASFNGVAYFSFFGGEGCDFMNLLFGFVAIFASTCFGGIAFGVVPILFVFLFDFGFEEIEGLVHSS